MTSHVIPALSLALISLALPALADGDAANGEKEFRKCKSCHSISSADADLVKGGKTGPNLYGVAGRTAGGEASAAATQASQAGGATRGESKRCVWKGRAF